MGSLESGLQHQHQHPQHKRAPLLRPLASSSSSRSFFHRPRSRLARFLLFEKVDYVQWACTVATFFFVVMLFQAFLPDKSGGGQAVVQPRGGGQVAGEQLGGGLDFGDGIKFVPWKLLEKFDKERKEANLSAALHGRTVLRAAVLRPRLALLFPDLSPDATHLRMITVALALRETGYDIEVLALEDGPVRSVWESSGFPVSITPYKKKTGIHVDWLRYHGVVANGLEAKPFISCLSQEPFKYVPAIWVIHQKSLALRLEYYNATNSIQLINDWKQAFTRVSVVVFPSHLLTMLYSTFDAGHYFVIPDSSTEAWTAHNYINLHGHGSNDLRAKLGYDRKDFVIFIVGSEFVYSGLLLEHMLVLKALSPILQGVLPAPFVKVGILNMNSSIPYNSTLEILASTHGFQLGTIHEISSNEDIIPFLSISDVVIYGSLMEVQSFPSILVMAMSLEKLIIAPELSIIKQYVDHRVNGYLFPKQNINMLTQTMNEVISNGKLTQLACNVASMGKRLARNMMVSETVEGYAFLLENILRLPSEVAMPRAVDEISLALRNEWRWDLFENCTHLNHLNGSNRSVIDSLERKWLAQMENSSNSHRVLDEAFSSVDWVEERAIEISNARKRLLEEELKDRTDQFHGTWEDVYRNAKKADRLKNELHERDDRELERTGQPLCIYEPYFGEGAWDFLHNTSLYRGIGMSAKGRRHGADDIDASSRLPILNSGYYRDVLGEYGAFFALANRVDRIHKNAWIGFQSWRASAMQVSLTKNAEIMLLDAIESRKHGDAMYFWVRMDRDPRNPNNKEFWDFCDAINAGNCRFAFSEALQRMYGVSHELKSLPPMPSDGDSWSVMHSWAMPTKSFLEFVMFSRMFVDALDAQMYEEHHQSGHCYLSLFKDRHCYSRVLELLVNVWAYHSARRMIYVDPETGAFLEQHKFKSRKGHMWVKWFSPAILKSMDEDLAEEWDMEHPDKRWLWPSTGEVFWQGVYERERSMRQQQKERRKQQSKDKIRRIKSRARQKTLGKYVKPPPEEGDSNTTTTTTTNAM